MEACAQEAIRNLVQTGSPPVNLDLENCGPYREIVETLLAAAAEGMGKVRQVFGDLSRQDPELTAVVSADPDDGHSCQIYWAADALKPQRPIQWIINRLFSVGSVSTLVGEPGSKKTYCLIDAAVCVALGQPWLGLETMQQTVLIVDEESGPQRLSRRLSEALHGHGAGVETKLAYTCLNGFDLRDSVSATRLEAEIRRVGAGFVIIDPLAMIMPGADENSVKDVQPVFKHLRQIAEATRAAIVVVHHTNRNGSYRGTSAIKGAVDAMIMVESKPTEAQVNFQFEKARDTEPFKFSARAIWSDGTFMLHAAEEASQGSMAIKLSPSEKYVVRYLREHGRSAFVKDITDHADTCSAEAARQAVYVLARKRVVRRSDPGGPGSKAAYELMSGW